MILAVLSVKGSEHSRRSVINPSLKSQADIISENRLKSPGYDCPADFTDISGVRFQELTITVIFSCVTAHGGRYSG
jgi:hypothetical protein